MKNFLSVWRIVGFIIFVLFLLWGWYVLDMFNMYWWTWLMRIRQYIFLAIWSFFLIFSVFRLLQYNHRWYMIHVLGLLFLILWIKIPILIRTIANRFHIVQLLYIGVIVTIILEYILIITSIQKKSLMILSFIFIIIQVVQMYFLDKEWWEYISLGTVPCLLLRWLWTNVFIVMSFTPKDKL
jgi:hypothetical protein